MKTATFLVFLFCIFAYLSQQSHEYTTLQIVHADSLFGDNETLASRDERWSEVSQRRFRQYLADLDGIESPGYSTSQGVLLARFQLGQPSTLQLTVVDTGSGFLWVTCEGSLYMPGDYSCTKSRGCTRIGCDDDYCLQVPYTNYCQGASNPNLCTFFISYKSGFNVDGEAVFDIAFFEGGQRTLLLGCGKVTKTPPFSGTGVMGLANTNGSVASQFDNRFSYFVGNLSDPYYLYSKLELGNDTVLKGEWTPMLDVPKHVMVRLRQIKVDGQVLDINPDILEGNGGTIIDSGSTLTYLPDEAYRVLRAKLDSSIPGFDDYPDRSELDYLCRTELEADDVPEVRFVFEGEAQMVMEYLNLFRLARNGEYCLNIKARRLLFRMRNTL